MNAVAPGAARAARRRSRRERASTRPADRRARPGRPRAAAGGRAGAVGPTTERVFAELAAREGAQAGGAGGGTTLEALRRVDAVWAAARAEGASGAPTPQFVTSGGAAVSTPEYDVVVAGGTLGIAVALSLQLRGHRACVVERGDLRGREQDWNISRKEVDELVALGLLSRDEADGIVNVEFNPVRAGFYGGKDVLVRDVLNLGVSPARLLESMRSRFEAAGGVVLERTGIDGIAVCEGGARIALSGEAGELTARLVLDCMGHGSPAVRQARGGAKPDGVCLVVGTCARGFPADKNTSGDLIFTCADIVPSMQGQYFWEAFPAGSGPTDRTTYMFTYIDAAPDRPTIAELLEEYWDLMPKYQGVELDDLEVLRVLFGFFPTYRDSPLPPAFDRVLQVGDASGIQSPLSFGGFGALTRHLKRLSVGVSEALETDSLDRAALGSLNPYQPNLSGTWLFQRAMSVPRGASPPRDFINKLLATNFAIMQDLGEPVLRPFLQDVVQFGPLGRTLVGMMASDPVLTLAIIVQLGPAPIADWVRHFAAMGVYDALHRVAGDPLRRVSETGALPARSRFLLRRKLDEWEFGAGLDYEL